MILPVRFNVGSIEGHEVEMFVELMYRVLLQSGVLFDDETIEYEHDGAKLELRAVRDTPGDPSVVVVAR